MADPTPRRRYTTLTAIEAHGDARRALCRRYDECLNVACAEGWTSFDCRGCEVRDDVAPKQGISGMSLLASIGGPADDREDRDARLKGRLSRGPIRTGPLPKTSEPQHPAEADL